MGITRSVPARLWRDKSGSTAIEYALIVAGVFLAIVAAVNIFVGSVGNMMNNVSNNVSGQM